MPSKLLHTDRAPFFWYPDDDALIIVIKFLSLVPYGVETWLQDGYGGHSITIEQFRIEAVYAG